uniref:Uncharacterized protein AlNc14C23G2355 n=1 Tax=Albugo laibachii Nc14 TaxID=890382 RepID=F0W656_9STRA|nr:conserved hypothetical protein [Albugo laibachii Nc14]|eukprot:CCA16598.1 conserved hypothetical protein [Albugo laibachii Nc14]
MGTTLTIANDTPDEWRCKLSYDHAALKMAGTALGIASIVGELTVLSAAFGPKLLGIEQAFPSPYTVFGCLRAEMGASALAAHNLGALVADLSTIGWVGVALFNMVHQKLDKAGYQLIHPSMSRVWGHLAPYSWHECACVRSYMVNATIARMQSIVMRPLFSGGFAKKNREHRIAWWLTRSKVQNDDVTIPSLDGILLKQGQVAAGLPQGSVLNSAPGNVSATPQLQSVQGIGTVAKPVALSTTGVVAPSTSPVNMQVKNTTASV